LHTTTRHQRLLGQTPAARSTGFQSNQLQAGQPLDQAFNTGIPHPTSLLADFLPSSSPFRDYSSSSTNITIMTHTNHPSHLLTSSTSANGGTGLVERDDYSIDRFNSDEVNSHPEYKYSTPTESMLAHKRAMKSNIEAFDAVFNNGNQG